MSEKGARERAGRLREANRVSASGATRTPPISAKASGTLQGILHGSRKASPSAWGDVKPYVKPPAKAVGDTLTGASGGRGRVLTVGGGAFGDLKLEGLYTAKMYDLGGVTDEILRPGWKFLLKTRCLTVGKTPWVKIRMMMSHFLEKGLTTLQRQSSKLGPKVYTLVKKEMKCV
jgi:hypothetical protein